VGRLTMREARGRVAGRETCSSLKRAESFWCNPVARSETETPAGLLVAGGRFALRVFLLQFKNYTFDKAPSCARAPSAFTMRLSTESPNFICSTTRIKVFLRLQASLCGGLGIVRAIQGLATAGVVPSNSADWRSP
jgi:hypothetical protein